MKRLAYIAALCMVPLVALAAVPGTMTYQGVLTDNGGTPVDDGNYTLTFRIYSAPSGGTALWEESQQVAVFGGVFNATLGTVTELSLPFDDQYWVGVSINGGSELVPRTQLTSNPYSLGTRSIPDSVVAPGKISDGTVVRSLNGLTDHLYVVGAGGAVVTMEGDTIVVNADAAGNGVWSTNGSDVYYNGGRVGIGTSTPKTPVNFAEGTFLIGADTVGAGDRLMFNPNLHSFRVGTVATGAASTYWDPDSTGLYSFASGLNTRAQGFGATAMGRDTEATNSYAFASGFFTNADGQYSTAMGFNTDALALGATAMGYSTDAEQNYSTALGYYSEAQAIYSVAIGNGVRAQSYSSMAVGRYNVGGGSAASWLSTDPVFEIGIGSSNSNRVNAVTVRKDGHVGIGTTVPLAELHVNGQVRFQSVEYFEDGGTNEIAARGDIRPTSDNIYDLGTSALRWDDVYATNGVIQTSDARAKTNVQDIEYGLDTVMQLRPVSFQWIDRPEQGEKLGLIAQEVQTVLPQIVKSSDIETSEEEDEASASQFTVEIDRLGINYSNLIPVLIKAVQDQQKEIEELKARLAAVESR